MALEALGSVATIAQLVSFTGEVLATGYAYLAKVKSAPKEISTLLTETSLLSATLVQLEWNSSSDSNPHAMGALETLRTHKVFEQCNKLLLSILETLKTCQSVHGQHTRNLGRRMMWPFKEKETQRILEQLKSMRETLTTAMVVDSATSLQKLEYLATSTQKLAMTALVLANEIEVTVSSTSIGVAQIQSYIESEADTTERQAIQTWLCPEDIQYESNFKEALELRQSKTGSWLFETMEYDRYIQDEGKCLWLYGIAGCGKTILSATIIKHLQQLADRNETAVLYFFCDNRDPGKQSFQNLLHTVVKQLLDADPTCFSDARALYKEMRSRVLGEKTAVPSMSVVQYLGLVKKMCQRWRLVRLVVDALDESEDIKDVVSGLRMLSANSNIKIILTSRHDISCQDAIAPVADFSMSLMSHMTRDISIYLRGEISRRLRDRSFKLRNEGLVHDIVYAIEHKAEGLILIAKLHLESICRLRSDGAIKTKLQNLPSGLNATYDEIIYQIYTEHKEDLGTIESILQWLYASAVPLTTDQLAEAVSIQEQDTRCNPDNIPTDILDILACCGSLVTIVKRYQQRRAFSTDLRGVELNIVTFAHASVAEYLSSRNIGLELASSLKSTTLASEMQNHFFMDPAQIHRKISSICLQYLSFEDFESSIRLSSPYSHHHGMRALRRQIITYPFLLYASLYWPYHFARSPLRDSLTTEVRPWLSWFLQPTAKAENYLLWKQIYHHDAKGCCRGRPPLHYALELQLPSLTALLLPTSRDVDTMAFGLSALHVASRFGSPTIAKELLKRGASLELKSSKLQGARTALHYAAEGGHPAVVTLLLMNGASVHAKSGSESTPLYRAARSGSISACKLLIEAGGDIDSYTWDRWTPLFEATVHKRPELACQLLAMGADPTIETSYEIENYSSDSETETRSDSKHGMSVIRFLAKARKWEDSAIQNIKAADKAALGPITTIGEDIKGEKQGTMDTDNIHSPTVNQYMKEILEEIETIRSTGQNHAGESGAKAYSYLYKHLHLHFVYLLNANLDTRSGPERDRRWYKDDSMVVMDFNIMVTEHEGELDAFGELTFADTTA